MVVKSAVLSALDRVMDPHMNVSLNEMGMVRSTEISPEGDVTVGIVFPCIGCPAWTMIQSDIKEIVATVPGVRSVKVQVLWDKPWSKSDLSQATREHIRSFGYQIFPMD